MHYVFNRRTVITVVNVGIKPSSFGIIIILSKKLFIKTSLLLIKLVA